MTTYASAAANKDLKHVGFPHYSPSLLFLFRVFFSFQGIVWASPFFLHGWISNITSACVADEVTQFFSPSTPNTTCRRFPLYLQGPRGKKIVGN